MNSDNWHAPFLGMAGSSLAICLASVGSGFGIAIAGTGIAGMGTFRPDLTMKSMVSVIMAGILGIYGFTVSILITSRLEPDYIYGFFNGIIHLAAGLCVGSCTLAAGFAIGNIGDAGSRACATNPQLFIPMLLCLIFSEIIGIFGLILAILLCNKESKS